MLRMHRRKFISCVSTVACAGTLLTYPALARTRKRKGQIGSVENRDVRLALAAELDQATLLHDPVLGYISRAIDSPVHPGLARWRAVYPIACFGDRLALQSKEYLFLSTSGEMVPVAAMWDRRGNRLEVRLYYGISSVTGTSDYPAMPKFLDADSSIRLSGFFKQYMDANNAADLEKVFDAWDEDFRFFAPYIPFEEPWTKQKAKSIWFRDLPDLKRLPGGFTICNAIHDGNTWVTEFNLAYSNPPSAGLARYSFASNGGRMTELHDYY